MKRFIKGQRGFTLIEIIIVLAILAILAALLGPHLGGFLRRGDRAAYDADRHTLELSVMAYYTADPVVREWPIWGPDVGAPYDHDNDGHLFDAGSARNGLIDIGRLVAAGLLADDAAIRSADGHSQRHRHATSEGSYIWYVADEDGTIKSMFWDAEDKDGDGDTTEWLGDGFWGVYP